MTLLANSLPVLQKGVLFFGTQTFSPVFGFLDSLSSYAALELTPQQTEAVSKGLLPAAYIERAACKAKLADDRGLLNKLSENMHTKADFDLTGLPTDLRTAVDVTVQECADIFQRSSSCVEGRNGHLALHTFHLLLRYR